MPRDRSDRRRARRLLAATPLLDPAWVGAQLGRDLTRSTAVDAYLEAPPGVSPHPLVELEWLDPARRSGSAGQNPLVSYLTHDDVRERAPHPLVDVAKILARDAAAADHPHGPLAAWVAAAQPDTPLPTPTGLPRVTWAEFREAAFAALRRHNADRRRGRPDRFTRTAPPAPDPLPPVTPDESGRPMVSVIMPAWNSAKTLRRAVESVQAQSWADWELVVVDDGSEDDTRSVLTGIARFDARVSAVHLPHHGVSRARNVGLARARGRYVAFLDADATWRPDFLRVMLEHLSSHGEWRMAHAVLGVPRPDGSTAYRAFEGTYDDLLASDHVDLDVLVAERELVEEVGGFDESLPRAVDYDLVLKLAARTAPHLVGYVGIDRTEDGDDPERISVRDPGSWDSVVRGRHLVDWSVVGEADRVPGRVSVVLPAGGSVRETVDWIRSTAPPGPTGADPRIDVELVVVGTRLRRAHRVIAEELCAVMDHASVVSVTADATWSLKATIGGARATGDRLVFVGPEVKMSRDDVVALGDVLEDPAVAFAQPLVLDQRGLVVSAGASFGDVHRPEPLLAGHHAADAEAMGGGEVPTPLGPVVAMSARTFLAARGFDALFSHVLPEVELALRTGGRTVLAPDARATSRPRAAALDDDYVAAARILDRRWPRTSPELRTSSTGAWRRAGFEVVGHRNEAVPAGKDGRRPGPLDDVFVVPRAVVRPRPRIEVSEGLPALRWTIDLAAPPNAEAWGDTHFARSLAAALRRRGQHVAVDSRAGRHRATRDLDDVVLVLRGLDLVRRRPGLVNVEWVISHPDLVTADEVRDFDLVYAASRTWATARSEAWDTEVRTLLQCTDPAVFHPDLAEPDTGPPLLFVGNSRGVYRTAVRTAVGAGLELELYGADWDRFVSRAAIRGRHVPNAELGRLYASAGITLNDHWEDMRRDGFLSNRLFDAAACGARIASDEVGGLAEVFGGQVQTFRDEADLVRLVTDPDRSFPDRETRRRLALEVVRNHSFDARAELLLEDAARLWRTRREGLAG